MNDVAIQHFLATEPLVQTATNDLTDSMMALVQRLELGDLPGLSLSADEVAVMAQLMQVCFAPPQSEWTSAWESLLAHCCLLAGFRSGILNEDADALQRFQNQLQLAIDAVTPLTEAYGRLRAD